MVDLRKKPFYLSDEDIDWVEQTISEMSLEEKIGQLFVILDRKKDKKQIKELFDRYHVGGCRYEHGDAEAIYELNDYFQQVSKIPVLIACNCNSGGDGACSDGTHIATAAACGASGDEKVSYDTGYVSGKESTAIGCNWNFGPVCDILYNWRNTIVNSRAYGNNPDQVLKHCKAYIEGMRKSPIAVCCKHFPGDGIEELDQHLVMGINTLECDEWDRTYGKVYQELIDAGIESIMAGHIALPAYSRKLRPGIKDQEICPATLAPELLQDLLRGKMGFNGLIVSDATHMVGMTSAMPRRLQVPMAIAAGCDMFLFFNDPEEDFQFMMDGYCSGIITEERLSDALYRILGLKAHLKLHEKQKEHALIPPKDGLNLIGCREHLELKERAAKESITLVKDTQNLLPMPPEKYKRVYMIVISRPPLARDNQPDYVRKMLREELEQMGYEVTVHQNYYDLTADGVITQDKKISSMYIGKIEEFKKKYDAVFVFINMNGFAQENTVRLSYSMSHSLEIPWYVKEVPTVFVSLNLTNHLIDVPMARTYINAYSANRCYVRKTLEKMAGKEKFLGQCDDNVFCDRMDTRW